MRKRITSDASKIADMGPEELFDQFDANYEEHTLMDEVRMLEKEKQDEKDRKAGRCKCSDTTFVIGIVCVSALAFLGVEFALHWHELSSAFDPHAHLYDL